MRVVQFTEFGDISRLHLAKRPEPRAHEGTAIIQVEAASVNPSDGKNVAGLMPHATLPRVPGRDYSGVVDGPAGWVDELTEAVAIAPVLLIVIKCGTFGRRITLR
jgi:NADPH:quinone reductase